MEALFTSTLVVALAEIGDKTQLLAILLAVQFRRPLAVVAGIFAATIANHFLAALVGSQAAAFLEGLAAGGSKAPVTPPASDAKAPIKMRGRAKKK